MKQVKAELLWLWLGWGWGPDLFWMFPTQRWESAGHTVGTVGAMLLGRTVDFISEEFSFNTWKTRTIIVQQRGHEVRLD